jgi:hypothetical protein
LPQLDEFMAYAGVLDMTSGAHNPQNSRIDYHQLLEKLMIL